ncbi:S1 family peptidase [Saccharothrix syringae]|uniref:Serine protease n=1 Tax=Saccharothrix syringae TaxID=103733 RepID=A0A5Q0H888_SACSY|nr:serine protease [Saccharothrix syringae]QFZ22436.1 serine protease [Saccharothrix syringae]
MRHLVAVLAAVLLLPLSTAPAPAATPPVATPPATTSPVTPEVDFTGTVSLRGCSGSVVRPPAHRPEDPALVLTNGHCVRLLGADEVVVEEAADRAFTALSPDGESDLGTLRAAGLAYATMSGTDVALYRLTSTYAQVEAMGVKALELSPEQAEPGTDIRVVSGYWREVYSCRADGYVHELREGRWTWRGSLRYTDTCKTIGGTSGSPVVDAATGRVVAVNNTGNEDGERCTVNNPCEVDDSGEVTVRHGARYGQRTDLLVPCLVGGGRVDLTAPGCELPRPRS